MAATVELSSRIVGTGPAILVLHGVFGSGDNWGTFVKPWQDRRTLHLVDLRNHGRSPHAKQMDYPTMAADVAAYIDRHGLGKVGVIGHSMGGKTGMQLAADFPDKVERLAVIDISPRAYTPHHQRYIEGMRALDLSTLESRAQAEERMAVYVRDAGVRQFLLKNLARDPDTGGFVLRLNLDVLAQFVQEVGNALPQEARIDCPLMFIGGGNSDYIGAQDEADILHRFPQAEVVSVPGAGHWVQVDQPQSLAVLLEGFFSL